MIGCVRPCQENQTFRGACVAALVKAAGRRRPPAQSSHHLRQFHVVAHASAAVEQTRRREQRLDPSLKGLRWTLLKDRHRLSADARADLDALISQAATKRTARAWLYREQIARDPRAQADRARRRRSG